jgi:hypothetical protein
MLWGVWYGGLTRDVLASQSVTLSGLPPVVAKVLYILTSLLWLAFIVYLLFLALQRTVELPSAWGKTFPEGLAQLRDLAWKLAVLLVGLWGFLAVTYWLFQSDIDFLLVLFGALQLPVWLGLELWFTGRYIRAGKG